MAENKLAHQFAAYTEWRKALVDTICDYRSWLNEQELNDAQIDQRIQQLLDRLREDKLNVAFVAEFSRGKSELINAIFFAGYGQRLLPSSAGRTTMCPTELLYDPSKPTSLQLLPIAPPAGGEAGPEVDYILEPGADAILDQILPLYVRNGMYRALVETAAAEQGARRTAMKSATDNAGEILEILTRTYNRARQAQITQEIAEIVGGAAALE